MAWRCLRPALRGLLSASPGGGARDAPGPVASLASLLAAAPADPCHPCRANASAAPSRIAPEDSARDGWASSGISAGGGSPGPEQSEDGRLGRDALEARVGEAVRQPPVWRYDEDANNTVYVSGVVLSDPQEHALRRHTATTFCYATLELGLLGGAVGTYPRYTRVVVKFWNHGAQQALCHLRKGSMIALRGELEEFMGRVKLVAREFGTLEDLPLERAALLRAYELHGDLGEKERDWRQMRASPSKLAALELHRQGQGLEEIAKARRVLWTTVAGYIAQCGFAGEEVDWGRFCRDIKLGPPGGHFLSVDEIHEVVEAARRKADGLWEGVNVRQVLQDLKAHPSAGAKIATQEAMPRGRSLGLAQVTAVMAMGRAGMTSSDWNRLWPEGSGHRRGREPAF